jgi:hypothetical protein
MEVSSLIARSSASPAGYALIEILVELAVAGCRAVTALGKRLAAAQRRAQARRELYALSDRSLAAVARARPRGKAKTPAGATE